MTKILVAGALGVVGRAVLRYAERATTHEIVGLSRRQPEFATRAQFVPVDLRDAAGCGEAIRNIGNVSHVVYAALSEQPSLLSGWTEEDQIRENEAMLHNLLDALEAQT